MRLLILVLIFFLMACQKSPDSSNTSEDDVNLPAGESVSAVPVNSPEETTEIEVIEHKPQSNIVDNGLEDEITSQVTADVAVVILDVPEQAIDLEPKPIISPVVVAPVEDMIKDQELSADVELNETPVESTENDKVNVIEEPVVLDTSPVAVDDTIDVDEDQVVFLSDLMLNDYSPIDEPLSIVKFEPTSNGVLEQLDSTGFKYTPSPNFYGIDSFTYTITDKQGKTATAQVTLNVINVNDIPIANADSYDVIQSQPLEFSVIDNDEGLGDFARLEIQTAPENGELKVLENQAIRYTAFGDYFGTDSFVYQLIDDDGDIAIASVQLSIECLALCDKVFSLSWQDSISAGVESYRVYVGTRIDQIDTYFEIGNFTSFDYFVDQKGEYFFAVSTVHINGEESDLSETIKAVF